MPIRILENEKEGHRKVKTDFRKKRQQEYMKKHGKPDKRRIQIRPEVSDKMQKLRDNLASVTGGEWGKKSGGRIGLKSGTSPKVHKQPLPPGYWKDRLKDVGKRYPRPKENLIEKLGGSEKAKPHSSPEGRKATSKLAIKRLMGRGKTPGDKLRDRLKDLDKGRLVPDPRYKPGPRKPIDPRSPYVKDRIMTPLRAKKAIGGAVKTIPRITKRFLDFIKTGKHVDKKGVKVNVPKAAERLTGKPHVDHGKRKRIKHLGKGKATGGRIRKGQGGSAAQQHYLQYGYGPTKTKLRSGKPKIAIKGW